MATMPIALQSGQRETQFPRLNSLEQNAESGPKLGRVHTLWTQHFSFSQLSNFSTINCCYRYRWGQIFILDSLANYTPKDEREAQSVCERVTPRLAHANAAVVLSAVKVEY